MADNAKTIEIHIDDIISNFFEKKIEKGREDNKNKLWGKKKIKSTNMRVILRDSNS